jgi:hypothetical protein
MPKTSRTKSIPNEQKSIQVSRRKRAPKDLATQYGENTASKSAPVVAPSPKKKRRSAKVRQQRQELIAPNEGVLERLAHADALASAVKATIVAANEADNGEHQGRRSRRWESLCGKCGSQNKFSSPAGICPHCGAIAVKV